MTREEKFIESLYDEAEEQTKEVYKEQKKNRDELLQEIALIMLTYTVLDGLMSLTSKDKKKEYNRLSNIILNSAKGQGTIQVRVINDILTSTVNKTFGFYSYNAKLKDVRKIIEANFKGKHFSTRVWGHSNDINKLLHKQVKNFLDGSIGVNDIKKVIMKTYNTEAYNITRLVDTEISRCSNSAFDRFCKEVGVKKVRYNASLDSKLCEDCAQFHEKVFDFDNKIEVPRHPLCRCFYTIENYDEKFKVSDEVDILKDDNSGIIKDETVDKFKNIYDQWDGNNIKEFAIKIVNSENLPLKVQRHQLSGANGQCQLSYNNAEMKILSYELDSNDIRRQEYQVKTAFHELFHAKANGVVHDVGDISFKDWAYIDDVFAESTAHYINKAIGINKEITPSYARHLIDTLPKLKKLPGFSNCNSIADFGEVAYKYRFSNKLNAEWKPLLDALNNMNHNMIEYSKNYLDYISENKSDLVDQLLENIPKYSSYKNNMIADLDGAIRSINNGYSLSGNENMIFENALIITMNRLGVK